MIDSIFVGETNTISKGQHYLNNPNFSDVDFKLKPKLNLEKKLCFLDFLEFGLRKSELGIKLMCGSLDDLDRKQDLIPKIIFNETDLKEFKDIFRLNEIGLKNFLYKNLKKNFIYKRKGSYGLTKNSRNIPLMDLDKDKYPCLNLYFKLFHV